MFRVRIFLASLALVASPCEAAESVLARAPLLRLQDAAEAVKPFADDRWAFTYEILSADQDGATRTDRFRFDPSRAEGERWTALDAAGETPDKQARKTLAGLNKKANDADSQLVYDQIGVLTAGAVLESETPDTLVFAAPIPVDKHVSEKMAKALEARIVLDRANGFISHVTTRNTASFKPSAIARVDNFLQEQSYAIVRAGWPPLLVEAKTEADGKALSRPFHSETEIRFSDFAPVKIAPPSDQATSRSSK